MKKIKSYLGVLMVALLTGCGEQTPLQKLQSDVLRDDMNNGFWGIEHSNQSFLWEEAVNYCDQHQEKPNCGVIFQIQIISAGSTVLPEYGSSRHELKPYNFKAANEFKENE